MYPLLTYSTSPKGPSTPPQFVVVDLGYDLETLRYADASYSQYKSPANYCKIYISFWSST
jgi:hypothetical protein